MEELRGEEAGVVVEPPFALDEVEEHEPAAEGERQRFAVVGGLWGQSGEAGGDGAEGLSELAEEAVRQVAPSQLGAEIEGDREGLVVAGKAVPELAVAAPRGGAIAGPLVELARGIDEGDGGGGGAGAAADDERAGEHACELACAEDGVGERVAVGGGEPERERVERVHPDAVFERLSEAVEEVGIEGHAGAERLYGPAAVAEPGGEGGGVVWQDGFGGRHGQLREGDRRTCRRLWPVVADGPVDFGSGSSGGALNRCARRGGRLSGGGNLFLRLEDEDEDPRPPPDKPAPASTRPPCCLLR